MKTCWIIGVLLIWTGHFSPVFATNVDLGTIEQPINLVAASNPSSIPLGAVVYESNYNYGIHKVITAPRPCRHGAMEWSGGTELNQNLASVFGISVEPEDSTNVPYAPVAIRIKAWKKPSYSPYSKEQVLAATLHCLMRSTGATVKNPLVIKIIAEDPKDLVWAKKYAKPYINKAEHGKPPVTPTPVPGTSLKTDLYGVTHVVFSHPVRQDSKVTAETASQPAMIASRMSGADNAEDACVLIPVWVGSTWKSSLDAIGRPCGLYHDLFNPTASISTDANTMFTAHRFFRMHTSMTPSETFFSLTLGEVSEKDLAAALYGVVFTAQPHQTRPLTITLQQSNGKLDQLTAFANDKGWKKTVRGKNASIECKFVLDTATGELSEGSIPLTKLVRTQGRALRILNTIQP